uniref:Reverse transcriptase domain-containing protein n=1 Tax=Plectus sambesii TaxID=2011161 RepID=A0A914VXU9_9BILA
MYEIVLGDFNTKVGMKQPYERSIGKFSYGNRNERGHMLIDFCEDLQLQVFNPFFKKRIGCKWTWCSPNGQTKNEIDFVLAPHNFIFINDKLYVSTANVEFHIHLPEDLCLPFLPEEMRSALMQMKTGKMPDDDHITTEMLKHGHETLVPVLTRLFITCLAPILLLSVIYKLLTKDINNRIEHILDESQPPEQAGFHRHFSTIDHLNSLNELIEKTHEYRRPLYMLFIDFEKAFDSVEANAVWSAIQEQGVHAELINLLRNIYTDAASEVRVNDERVEIDIHRGVRQGDTILPKLFTACLEQMFRRLPWDDRGININGRCLSNLRLADDIVLFANTADELQQMASELNDDTDQVGLKINSNNAKTMSTMSLLNSIHLDDNEIEAVDNYIYFGQLVTIVRDHTREIRRRKQTGWAVFHQYRNFLTSRTVDMKYKQ